VRGIAGENEENRTAGSTGPWGIQIVTNYRAPFAFGPYPTEGQGGGGEPTVSGSATPLDHFGGGGAVGGVDVDIFRRICGGGR